MNKFSLSALVAAGVLAGGFATSASAADLGGNCCADLEERIAELEATTARKGNRKVSLTISGWVSQQVMYWDDGVEKNTYVSDIGTTLSSNVKFTGSATISPGYSAGYVMHIETVSSEALLGINQNQDNGRSILADRPNAVQVVQSYWFVKSDQLGKVSIGLQSHASDNTAILVDGSGSLVPANYVAFDYGGFFHAASARPLIADIACMDCNGVPNNAVRYDSPTFAGFSLSASWGEDDFWDIAARYSGEFNGIKVAVAGAYSESTDNNGPGLNQFGAQVQPLQGGDSQFFQIGAYVQHVPTGLFLYGAYATLDVDNGGESDSYYVKAGIRQRWSSLGHTVAYGEYLNGNIDNNAGLGVSENSLWGIGLVQEIDAAAMSVWLSYRDIEAEQIGVLNNDFDYVKFGALINF
ncbi:MAG: porin [Hyphomicrobium sp.]|nr:porin [Hyphomicrobium sp.]